MTLRPTHPHAHKANNGDVVGGDRNRSRDNNGAKRSDSSDSNCTRILLSNDGSGANSVASSDSNSSSRDNSTY